MFIKVGIPDHNCQTVYEAPSHEPSFTLLAPLSTNLAYLSMLLFTIEMTSTVHNTYHLKKKICDPISQRWEKNHASKVKLASNDGALYTEQWYNFCVNVSDTD